MSSLPKVAIVGRPNVGKSAIFNAICNKRIAIVDEAEGITRDRLYSVSELFGRPFEVIDTGGIDPRSKAPFNEQVKQQAEIAIEEADSIIMVVDVQIGVTPLDSEVAKMLLSTDKPLCLAVNKIDHPSQEWQMHAFHELGIKKIVPISASQRWHIAELLETALENVQAKEGEPEKAEGIKVAIIGRPNVGKSSLLNYLMDEERCIVSPIPGTTRDSIDIPFILNDQKYTLIDTAGIRRKFAEKEVVDKFAAIRTTKAIERADLCILMVDAQQGLTTQEKRIASEIEEAGKGCILLFNKWDLVKGFRMEHCLKSIENDVPFLKHCPKLFISAKTGRNVDKIFTEVDKVYEASRTRITTHQLNKFIIAAIQKTNPPMITGKRLRIYYMAQVGIEPPTFIFFVNYPALMTDTYKKYLYNQFREVYAFTGCPIRMFLKGRKRVDREDRQATLKPADHKPSKVEEAEEWEEEYEDHSNDDSHSEEYDLEDMDDSWK